MKPPPFDYCRPASLADALACLQEAGGDARVLAGGQSLLPQLNRRELRPGLLVDLRDVPELVSPADAEALCLSPLATVGGLRRSSVVAELAPLLASALRHAGPMTVQTRATIGGAAAFADPAAEVPTVLMALDAVLHTQHAGGARDLAAGEMFVGAHRTALRFDEILTGITIPVEPRVTCASFVEVSRKFASRALASVAVALRTDGDDVIDARVVLGAVADAPVRATEVEAVLAGADLDDPSVRRDAIDAVAAAAPPYADQHAGASYRAQAVRALLRRALCECAVREREPGHVV